MTPLATFLLILSLTKIEPYMRKLYPFLLTLLISVVAHAAPVIDTTLGLTAPGNVTGHYQDLAHYLCDNAAGDEAKVNAIFNWITHNIKYDIKGMTNIDRDPDEIVERALGHRKAICEGYSMLFTEMCREVGIKAVNVDGYAKNWTTDNGDEIYIPRHMWNAVLVNGSWKLFDATWAAGYMVQSPTRLRKFINFVTRKKIGYAKRVKFQYHFDTGYYMQDPLVFRFKHLPADPVWQITDTLMPAAYFVAGDSAVKVFNTISHPIKNNDELTRIANLEEKQKLFESADRSYQYNNKYASILAIKHTYRAMAQIKKAFTDSTVQEGRLLIMDAQTALKQSQEYISAQKKVFPAQYSALSKKNKAKSQDAKQYLRALKADSKRNIAQLKKYDKSAGSGRGKLGARNAEVRRYKSGISAGRLSRIESGSMQKKTGAPELRDILDSVTARTDRVSTLQADLAKQHQRVKGIQEANEHKLDSLGKAWALADSYLVVETKARLALEDNNDDKVINCSKMYKTYKLQQTDTLQKYYLVNYDTINNLFAQRYKLHKQQLDLHKKDLRALEQYRKLNSTDTSINARYVDIINVYVANLNEYNQDIAAHASYMKGNRMLFSNMAKQTNWEVKRTEYLMQLEDVRKMMEAKEIEKYKSLDNRENQKQKVAIEKARGQLQKITDKLN
jgi:hypothetical protein